MIKYSVRLFILGIFVCGGAIFAQAQNEYERFEAYADMYYSGTVSAKDMIQACDEAIQKDAVGNAAFLSVAHATKGAVLVDMQNMVAAREQIALSIKAAPKVSMPYLILAVIEQKAGNAPEQAKALRQAMKYTTDSAMKKELGAAIKKIEGK